MNTTDTTTIEQAAKAVITKLLAAGKGREASQLGEVLGSWRKGRVGDCLLRSATKMGKNSLEKGAAK